jgi:hypothetical protein
MVLEDRMNALEVPEVIDQNHARDGVAAKLVQGQDAFAIAARLAL